MSIVNATLATPCAPTVITSRLLHPSFQASRTQSVIGQGARPTWHAATDRRADQISCTHASQALFPPGGLHIAKSSLTLPSEAKYHRSDASACHMASNKSQDAQRAQTRGLRCNTGLQQVTAGVIHGCHMLCSSTCQLSSLTVSALVCYNLQSLHSAETV
jgi:hypothetical protein